MALDKDRAQRIHEQKQLHPELTWRDIAEKVGVSERSALDWQQTGGVSHPNCKKLAAVFGVDPDWLWSGVVPGTPDLMKVLSNDTAGAEQLDRIERKVDALLMKAKIDPAAFDSAAEEGVADIVAARAGSMEVLGGGAPAKPPAKRAPARKRRAS